MSDTWRVLQGTVFNVLPTIERGSIDCVVTSPPYYALRAYLKADDPLKPLELGSEKTVQEYIDTQVRVFSLVRETMSDYGVAWVNIGDSYSSQGGSGKQGKNGQRADRRFTLVREGGTLPPPGIPAGNLCLVPQRLALALQADGWVVRSVVCWRKPAPMPASLSGWAWKRCRVKVGKRPKNRHGQIGDHAPNGDSLHFDHRTPEGAAWQDCPGCKKCEPNGGYVLRRGSWRPTSSWEPILMLAKSASYFSDGEPVKTAPAAATVSRDKYTRVLYDPDEQFAVKHDHETLCDVANARDVLRLPLEKMSREELMDLIRSRRDEGAEDLQSWASQPLKEKHYAAYPETLVTWCLKCSTSEKGYCAACGAPWCRVIDRVDTGKTQKMTDGWDTGPGGHGTIHRDGSEKGQPGMTVLASKTLGWRPTCQCGPDAGTRPARVLDPFSGSGRTGIAALRLGLHYTGCELSPDYVAMSSRLLAEEEEALRLERWQKATPIFDLAERTDP